MVKFPNTPKHVSAKPSKPKQVKAASVLASLYEAWSFPCCQSPVAVVTWHMEFGQSRFTVLGCGFRDYDHGCRNAGPLQGSGAQGFSSWVVSEVQKSKHLDFKIVHRLREWCVRMRSCRILQATRN